jgi:hypothetical protein
MSEWVIDLDEINPPGMDIHDAGTLFIIRIPDPPRNIVGAAYAKGTAKFTADILGTKRRIEGKIEKVLFYSGPILEITVNAPMAKQYYG